MHLSLPVNGVSVFSQIMVNSTPDNTKVNEDNSETNKNVQDFECFQKEKSLDICLSLAKSADRLAKLTNRLIFDSRSSKSIKIE